MDNELREETLVHVSYVLAPLLQELFTQVRAESQVQSSQTIVDTEVFGVSSDADVVEPPDPTGLGEIPEIEFADITAVDSPEVPPTVVAVPLEPEIPSPKTLPPEIEASFGVPPSAEQSLPSSDVSESLGEGAAIFDEHVEAFIVEPPADLPIPEVPDRLPPPDLRTFDPEDPTGGLRSVRDVLDGDNYKYEPVLEDLSEAGNNLLDRTKEKGDADARLLQSLADGIEDNRRRIEEVESSFERDRY